MAIDRSKESVFYFEGKPVPFIPGQTVGAAMMAVGIRSWRSTRIERKPRGLFCAIGVCFDCLTVVEGVPNQRACLVSATPGLAVTTQEGTGHDHLAI